MKIIGIIPARWASTRLKGKVLADILGQPMIQHVWQRAKQSTLLEEVYIACDEQQVFQAAEGFGATAIMTSKEHTCGTERIAQAADQLDADIIVNIQGDEPLIDAKVLDLLAQVMKDDSSVVMATAVKRFRSSNDIENPSVVKVVIDHNKDALYFSRSVIPFYRDSDSKGQTFFKHVGLYAYRKEFLIKYKDLPLSVLEEAEKLEQLRALEAGIQIRTVETDYDSIAVDTPQDLETVINLLKNE